jgi:hypothetical protein
MISPDQFQNWCFQVQFQRTIFKSKSSLEMKNFDGEFNVIIILNQGDSQVEMTQDNGRGVYKLLKK